jgi:hypothetical protein
MGGARQSLVQIIGCGVFYLSNRFLNPPKYRSKILTDVFAHKKRTHFRRQF